MQENKQEKSPIKQKILFYLKNKGVSPYEFYKESGVTRGILSQDNGISEENIAKFLAYSQDININWLFTGHGTMINNDPIDSEMVSEPIRLLESHENNKNNIVDLNLIETIKNQTNIIREQAEEIGRLRERIDYMKNKI